jgi:hypothetical protein
VASGTSEVAGIYGFNGDRCRRRPTRFALLGASQMARLGGEEAEVVENIWRCSSELGAMSSGEPKRRSKLGFQRARRGAPPLSPVPLPFHAPPPPLFECAWWRSHHGSRQPRREATQPHRSLTGWGGKITEEEGTGRWGPPVREPEKEI